MPKPARAGDHLTLLNAYYAWKSNGEDKKWTYDNFLNARSLQSGDSVRQQLARLMARYQLQLVSTEFSSKAGAAPPPPIPPPRRRRCPDA